MCLIILQTPQTTISEKRLEIAFKGNPDGAGYGFSKDGELVIKRFMKYEPFLKQYLEDYSKYGKDKYFLIHFRWTTHGVTNLKNVHPFKVNSKLIFAHNGVINNVPDDPKLSDTVVFNRTVLQQYNHDFLSDEKLLKKWNRKYTSGSKLVFLNNNNVFKIINEKNGIWNKDNWYSNSGFRKKVKYSKVSNYGYNYDWIDGSYSGSYAHYCDACSIYTPERELITLTYTTSKNVIKAKKRYCIDCVETVLNREHCTNEDKVISTREFRI